MFIAEESEATINRSGFISVGKPDPLLCFQILILLRHDERDFYQSMVRQRSVRSDGADGRDRAKEASR